MHEIVLSDGTGSKSEKYTKDHTIVMVQAVKKITEKGYGVLSGPCMGYNCFIKSITDKEGYKSRSSIRLAMHPPEGYDEIGRLMERFIRIDQCKGVSTNG